MLQRVQAVLTLVLLGAVVFMGVALYRGQQANEAATAHIMATLDKIATAGAPELTSGPAKYPAVFVFYSEKTDQSAPCCSRFYIRN